MVTKLDQPINSNGEQEKFCPYLGMERDETTSYAFPSPQNICYRSVPAASPSRAHQRAACQSPEYIHCPVYASDQPITMPRNIWRKRHRSLFRRWIGQLQLRLQRKPPRPEPLPKYRPEDDPVLKLRKKT